MKNGLQYYSEGDGVDYEIWIDPKTTKLYHVPISIERDFENKVEIIRED